MAKGTWTLATSPNDPIFNGKCVISSHNATGIANPKEETSPIVSTKPDKAKPTGNKRKKPLTP